MHSSPWIPRTARVAALAAGLLFGVVGVANGQEETTDSTRVADTVVVADPAVADSVVGMGPSGAFLRSAIIPGWGHTTTGSPTRGAFYFSVEALAGWMVFKTQRRLGVARDQAELWEEVAMAELAALGHTDPEEIDAALADHEQVARFRGLVDARREQREDWLAVAIFTMLISGVDAFVSAHLGDFPEPLTIDGDPLGGTVELGVRVPVG